MVDSSHQHQELRIALQLQVDLGPTRMSLNFNRRDFASRQRGDGPAGRSGNGAGAGSSPADRLERSFEEEASYLFAIQRLEELWGGDLESDWRAAEQRTSTTGEPSTLASAPDPDLNVAANAEQRTPPPVSGAGQYRKLS